MYLKVPLNSIKTALGQDMIHFSLIVVLMMFWIKDKNYDPFNYYLLGVHVLAIVAIIMHEMDSVHVSTREAIQMIAAIAVISIVSAASQVTA